MGWHTAHAAGCFAALCAAPAVTARYLYVSEAFNKGGVPVSNKVLRFTLRPDGSLGDKVVFKDFAADGTAYSDVDGMRTDTAGGPGLGHALCMCIGMGTARAAGCRAGCVAEQQRVTCRAACVMVKGHPVCCLCAGNLFVSRYDDGQIVMLSPAGATLKTFQLPFSVITNLEMGGKDGRTLVAVGGCGPGPRRKTKKDPSKGCVEVLKADAAPGRAWQMLQDGLPKQL